MSIVVNRSLPELLGQRNRERNYIYIAEEGEFVFTLLPGEYNVELVQSGAGGASHVYYNPYSYDEWWRWGGGASGAFVTCKVTLENSTTVTYDCSNGVNARGSGLNPKVYGRLGGASLLFRENTEIGGYLQIYPTGGSAPSVTSSIYVGPSYASSFTHRSEQTTAAIADFEQISGVDGLPGGTTNHYVLNREELLAICGPPTIEGKFFGRGGCYNLLPTLGYLKINRV